MSRKIPCPTCGSMRLHIGKDGVPGESWYALCDDCYDGAPDAEHIIGRGETPGEAMRDWQEKARDLLDT